MSPLLMQGYPAGLDIRRVVYELQFKPRQKFASLSNNPQFCEIFTEFWSSIRDVWRCGEYWLLQAQLDGLYVTNRLHLLRGHLINILCTFAGIHSVVKMLCIVTLFAEFKALSLNVMCSLITS